MCRDPEALLAVVRHDGRAPVKPVSQGKQARKYSLQPTPGCITVPVRPGRLQAQLLTRRDDGSRALEEDRGGLPRGG